MGGFQRAPNYLSARIADSRATLTPGTISKAPAAEYNSRAPAWLDVFTDQQRGGVAVNYAAGRRLSGWPAYFSDDPEEGLLYLRSAAWVDADSGVWHDIEADGILIDTRDGIESIEFLKGGAKNA